MRYNEIDACAVQKFILDGYQRSPSTYPFQASTTAQLVDFYAFRIRWLRDMAKRYALSPDWNEACENSRMIQKSNDFPTAMPTLSPIKHRSEMERMAQLETKATGMRYTSCGRAVEPIRDQPSIKLYAGYLYVFAQGPEREISCNIFLRRMHEEPILPIHYGGVSMRRIDTYEDLVAEGRPMQWK